MFNKLSITFSAIVPEEKASIAAIQKALHDLTPEVINALLGAYLGSTTGIPPYLIHSPKIEAGFVPAPGQQDAFLAEAGNWLESKVTDGSTTTGILAHHFINYALYSPVRALDVICDRMSGEEESERESGTPVLDAILSDFERAWAKAEIEFYEGPCIGGRPDHTPNEHGDCDECRARVFITPQLPVVTPPVNPLANTEHVTTPSISEVLDEVEGFIAGFEGDATKEDVTEMLGRVRALHKQCSEDPPVTMKTAFLAVFHGVIGAYHSSEGNPRYPALWPADGRFDTDLFFAERSEAIEQSAKLMEIAGYSTKKLELWVEEAGWSLPTNA